MREVDSLLQDCLGIQTKALLLPISTGIYAQTCDLLYEHLRVLPVHMSGERVYVMVMHREEEAPLRGNRQRTCGREFTEFLIQRKLVFHGYALYDLIHTTYQ